MTRTPQSKSRKPATRAASRAAPPKAAKPKAPVRASSEWASGVVFAQKEAKLAVSLRLDADVLRFFRNFGSGYQTRINEVLRVFMDAHTPAGGNGSGAPTRRAARK